MLTVSCLPTTDRLILLKPVISQWAWLITKKQAIKAYEIIGSALDPSAQVTNKILTVKSLLPPLTREEIGVVRCLGLNYADHAVCQPFVRPVI